MPPHQPEPGLDLGDLGAADGNTVRGWPVELDHRAVALLADKGHMGNCHDMAAVHPDEQAGIKLSLGLRDRPRAHPLADPVMHPGVMRIGADAADFRRIDEMRAVGTLDRQPWRG